MTNDKTTARSATDPAITTVVIGLATSDAALAGVIQPSTSILAVNCNDLRAFQVPLAQITCAICSLFAQGSNPQSDAVCVIEALRDAGYAGDVIVLAPPLLRPKMVENELRGMARGMRLRLIHGVLPSFGQI